jgi:hypothetical protein
VTVRCNPCPPEPLALFNTGVAPNGAPLTGNGVPSVNAVLTQVSTEWPASLGVYPGLAVRHPVLLGVPVITPVYPVINPPVKPPGCNYARP